MKLNTIILFPFLILCHGLTAQPQPAKMNLPAMIDLALENNPDYKNSELNIRKSEFEKNTAWEPGQTLFDWTHGQINTLKEDDYFLILQELGSPFSQASKSRVLKEETEYYKLSKNKTEKEIRREISIAYNDWLYYSTIDSITLQTLGLLEKAAGYAGIQYSAGESNLLSKMLTETKYLDMKSYKRSIDNNKFEAQVKLMKLTFSENGIIPAEASLLILDDSLILVNENQESHSSPDLALADQMKKVASSNLGYQRSVISPDIRAGYFNQKIDHVSGFNGWQIGIGFPLWFFPQRSRIQMAMIDRSIAENQYQYRKAIVVYDLMTLYNKLNLLNERIVYFQDRLLLNAATIEDNAVTMYNSGEIGYIEYIQNIITANKSREDYWTLVRDHNQVIYQIEYYMQE